MTNYLPNFQQWERGPKIVAIGGGTGLSTMLRGLKRYTKNLTAIVTVADDGFMNAPTSSTSAPDDDDMDLFN